MRKEGKKYTIIVLAVVIIIAITMAVFNKINSQDNNKPKYLDISHVYVAEDFPDNDADEQSMELFLNRLNTDYNFLRENNQEVDPYDVWLDIGNTKLSLKDINGAKEAWEQAISLSDTKTLAYANLANLYKDFIHDYDQAKYYYDLAITKDNVGNFQDYQSFAELYLYYLPEDANKIETIMLSGADKAGGTNKVPFYYYLYDYFKGKDQSKVNFYHQKVMEADSSFDWSQYQ